jgi:hypothetical protein
LTKVSKFGVIGSAGLNPMFPENNIGFSIIHVVFGHSTLWAYQLRPGFIPDQQLFGLAFATRVGAVCGP